MDFERGRILHFLRHGSYENIGGVFGGQLTPLGRRQARQAGKHLSQWPIQAIHCSDYQRAHETATLAAAQLGISKLQQHRFLRELQPSAVRGYRVPLATRREARASLTKVEARFFRRTRGLRHELVVCHGNLIRALVCRVLKAPRTTWRSVHTHHCGVTTFVVGDGPALVCYNDVSYLPRNLRSMS